MDHRVRDLDQIQEEDGDERARRLGTILMACAAILGLSLALGVVVKGLAEELGRHRADRYDLVIPQLSAPGHRPLGWSS